MTAWTALVGILLVIAKCALDMIGLEYQAKYQCLTDGQFNTIAWIAIVFAGSIDLCNLIVVLRRTK